jgi:spermidine/putrescine transport system permease protein
MDPDLREAALDLGCTPTQAFFKGHHPRDHAGHRLRRAHVLHHELDDFVISYFVYGPNFVTLPVEIYNYTKKPLQPKIYALFTLMFLVILLVMVLMNLLQARDDKEQSVARRLRPGRRRGGNEKTLLPSCSLRCSDRLPALPARAAEGETINVYNWGQYISDGTDGSIDVNAEFTKAHRHQGQLHDLRLQREPLHQAQDRRQHLRRHHPVRLHGRRLISEDMLEKLDLDNIPNYQYVDEAYKNQAYDPDNAYSVPYTWGTVGVIYNTKYVERRRGLKSWSCSGTPNTPARY